LRLKVDDMDAYPFNILFVDDEIEFLETLIKRMKKRGIKASGVKSGEEALGFLAENQADIVVLDVRMPGMDGVQTLRKIKKGNPLIEVIMLTGHACLEVAREGMEIGAFDYLMKPIDIDELIYKLEDAYGKIKIHKEKIEKLKDVSVSLK